MSFVVSVPFNPDITPLHRVPIVSAVYFEPPVLPEDIPEVIATLLPVFLQPSLTVWWTHVGFEPLLFRAKESCSRYTTWPIIWFFPFVLLARLFNARSSRLVTALGWKLPSKSIPTAFHVFLDGLEPPSQCLNMHQRSYSTLPLSYRNIYIVDTGGTRTHGVLHAMQTFYH